MKKQNLLTYEKLFFSLLVIIPLIPYSSILTEVINSIVFLLLCVIFILFSIRKSFDYKIDYFSIAIFLLCLISVFISKDRIITYMDSFYLLSGIISYLIIKRSDIDKDKVFLSIFIGSSLCSFLGIIRYLTYSDSRLDGLFNYANSSALLFAIAIVIYYAVLKDIDWKKHEKMKYILRINLFFLMCALFLTQSRGGLAIYALGIVLVIYFAGARKLAVSMDMAISNFIAIIFSYLILNRQFMIIFLISPLIIFYIAVKFNRKYSDNKYKYILISISVLGIMGIVYEGFSRIKEISINNAQLQERFVFYQDALKLIIHNPGGIGAGNYSALQYLYQSANYSIKYVHNGFLQIAVDFGILTLLLFLAFIINKFVQAYKYKRSSDITIILIIMILLHSLVDFSLSFVYIDIILFICLGLNTDEISEDKANRGICRSFAALLLVLNLLILMFIPGEIIYNISTNLADSDNVSKAYSILKLWNGVPFKTSRYYEKSALWAFKIYSDGGDKRYLNNVISDMDKAISDNDKDPRLLETEGTINYLLKDYKQAVSCYERSKKMRIFYLPVYEELKKSYRCLYDNKDITEAELKIKIDNLDSETKALKLKLNPGARFMQDQP